MYKSELEQVEAQIANMESMVSKGEKLQKLFSNRIFKELILEDYLEGEAVRQTQLLSDPQHREAAVGELMAISRFGQHLRMLEIMSGNAEVALEEAKQARAEVLADEE